MYPSSKRFLYNSFFLAQMGIIFGGRWWFISMWGVADCSILVQWRVIFVTVLCSWVWEDTPRCNGKCPICRFLEEDSAQWENKSGMVPLLPWKAWELGTEMQRQYCSQQDEYHKHRNCQAVFWPIRGYVEGELDLISRPAQMYNVDETGMPLDPKAHNVITVRGAKKVQYTVH